MQQLFTQVVEGKVDSGGFEEWRRRVAMVGGFEGWRRWVARSVLPARVRECEDPGACAGDVPLWRPGA